MIIRVLILSLSFLSMAAYMAKASQAEPVFSRDSFASFPMRIGNWEGREEDVGASVLTKLGVDDHLNRLYVSGSGVLVAAYIGFYQSQRQGSSIHSPMNCLPGAGWNPVERTVLSIPLPASGADPSRSMEINRIIIQKGPQRQLVLYWYQSHGRVIASEYAGKLYTVFDAIRMNRTDGALVRIVSPILQQNNQSLAAAETEAVEFVQSIVPLLPSYLPR